MKDRLRIGIDGRILGARPKGIARYIWELCKGLDEILPHAEFFLYSPEPTNLLPISNRWHERVETGWARQLPNSLWAVTRPGHLARYDSLDVFWGGTGLLPLIGPSTRSVLTVHDLVYKLIPESMSFRARITMKLFFERSLARADTIVANSRGTADRLRAALGYEAAATVRPGVSSQFRPEPEHRIRAVLEKRALKRPYLLGVGTVEPRKNLDTLIRTFCNLQARSHLSDYSLVLAGDRGWRDGGLLKQLNRSGTRVSWLGFVEDEELPALYSGCSAFVFPSKYEGFGMPVLEARACGARVVTTDCPELREAGGPDVTYVAPNETGLAEGILLALATSEKTVRNSREHSWAASSAILAAAMAD